MYTIEHEDSPFTAEERAARAKSMVGDKSYDMLTNNCEHRATEIYTGKKYSQQVAASVTAAGAGLMIIAGAELAAASAAWIVIPAVGAAVVVAHKTINSPPAASDGSDEWLHTCLCS